MLSRGCSLSRFALSSPRQESIDEEITLQTSVDGTLTIGAGDEARTFICVQPELTLDPNVEKQWKQIGNDPLGLRLQATTHHPHPLLSAPSYDLPP